MSPRAASVALALPVLGALAGCAGAPSSAPTNQATTSDRSTSSADPVAGSASPVPITAAAGTPLGAGERVWAAFSNRGLSQAAWWAKLQPLLSDAARAVYVYDDPRRIPSMKIAGNIHVAAKAPGEPKYTAEVVVPTSIGEFDLDLERHTLRSGWLLYAIKFPPAVQ